MFTQREKFIINIFNELQQDVADACDGMLSNNRAESLASIKNLLISIEALKSLIKEDEEV